MKTVKVSLTAYLNVSDSAPSDKVEKLARDYINYKLEYPDELLGRRLLKWKPSDWWTCAIASGAFGALFGQVLQMIGVLK